MKEKTYFIRHKDSNHDRLVKLMEQARIAIYYDEAPWSDVTHPFFWRHPDHQDKKGKKYYQTYRSSVGFFQELSTNGGMVFAEYGDGLAPEVKKGCLVGRVLPGTPVEGFSTIPVTLKLVDVKVIDYSVYKILLAIRPPFSTICCPQRTFDELADHLLNNKPLLPSKNLLHHSVAEQMCVEYLRHVGLPGLTNEKLHYLSLNVGKTMETIDIAGRLVNGREIIAQVKNGDISPKTLQSFSEFVRPDQVGVIFAKNVEDKVIKNIYHINIDKLFQHMLKAYPQMIRDMIGLDVQMPLQEEEQLRFKEVA